jgi:glycosyltransferase involved in cell wall biosynthesis
MEAPRGILEVLDAVALLLREGRSLELRLVGDGGRDLPLFREHAASLGLQEPTVRFLGQLPNREALAEVAKADVGLVPHHADDSWNTTIPNKLFDYMAAGLPVVTSSAIPAARVVRETGCGVVYQSQDADGSGAADCATVRARVSAIGWPRRGGGRFGSGTTGSLIRRGSRA